MLVHFEHTEMHEGVYSKYDEQSNARHLKINLLIRSSAEIQGISLMLMYFEMSNRNTHMSCNLDSRFGIYLCLYSLFI